MIKYIGSKRTLVPEIVQLVRGVSGARSVIDLFSGTSRVGHALKAAGFQVFANDHNAYAAALARCYVQADAEDVLADARLLVEEFNALRGSPGYFTETFCVKSRFFQPKNGERIDAIREAIAARGLEPELEAVMLASLMEAADRVDSTTGLQMAYLKQWAPRRSPRSRAARPRRAAAGRRRQGAGDAPRRLRGGRRPGGGRRLRRPSVQPALVPGQLPRLGIAGALGQARGVRGGMQAVGREAAEERLQLTPRIR